MIKSKQGNIIYSGGFTGVRYHNSKFYARFSADHIREVPQDNGGSIRQAPFGSDVFDTFPRVFWRKS